MGLKEAKYNTSDLILWLDGSKRDAEGVEIAELEKSLRFFGCNLCKIPLRKNKEIWNVKL